MNIIIPIGGVGERFAIENYTLPKPLIPVLGRPMIYRLISSLSISPDDNIRIIYNSSLIKYNFEELIKFWFPKLSFSFVSLPKQTKGPTETLKFGIRDLDLSQECLLLDCDTFYEKNILELYRNVKNKNCIFYFNTTDPNPIYSYVKLNDDDVVVDIAEKIKISDNANVGAYGFRNGHLLSYYINNMKATYVSEVYKKMLKTDEKIHGVCIDNFHCVGTPLQLKSYCNRFRNKSEPLRICFDLDNTLVTYPDITGDYTTVRPITRNIEFLKLLKSLGHYIIIYTARRMKTHKGNVGAILADVGQITINTLKKYEIKYDELHFGKPHANYYIDDLAVNPYVSLYESTGFYNTITKSRTFNDLSFTENQVTKTTNNTGEIHWYNNIPENIKDLFPEVYSLKDNTITMENIDGVSYSHLLISEQLKINDIDVLMNNLNKLHDLKEKSIENIYSVYSRKLTERFINYNDLYKTLELQELYHKINSKLKSYEKSTKGLEGVIHGDPVFTNIIKTETSIKFIDMRGKIDKETIHGDIYYDYAKIYQSLLGYDFILNDVQINYEYLKTLREYFEMKYLGTDKYREKIIFIDDLKILTASLYLSFLPLHEYDKNKFSKYINIIKELI